MTVIPDPRGGHVWIYGMDGDGNPVKVLVDAGGRLQVEVLEVALPGGAATAANQSTMITALQLIDDLRNALASVATDDIRVAPGANPLTVQALGGDKLFSIESVVLECSFTESAAGGVNYLYSSYVPTGKIWIVNYVCAYDGDSAPGDIWLGIQRGGTPYWLDSLADAVALQPLVSRRPMTLAAGDRIQVYFEACILDDDIYLFVNGYQMDAPS